MSEKIAVVMACYNGEKYLARQFRSIERQSRRPDMLVIIDDASTDGTLPLLRKLGMRTEIPLRLAAHGINKGYRATFFEAMRMAVEAGADRIYLSDQDDLWSRNKLERMEQVMEEHPRILSLATTWELIGEEGELLPGSPVSRGGLHKVSLRQVLRYNTAMGCTLGLRRRLCQEVLSLSPLPEELSLPHDWTMNVAAATREGLYLLREPLIRYRLHGGNTLGLHRAASVRDRIQDYENLRREKEGMEDLLAALGVREEIPFVRGMDASSRSREEALREGSAVQYVKSAVRDRYWRYMKPATVAWDLWLLKKEGRG